MDEFWKVISNAATQKPELVLFLCLAIYLIRYAVNTVVEVSEKFTTTTTETFDKLVEHASRSDIRTTEAIVRCSEAVSQGRKTQEDTNRLVEQFLKEGKRDERG